MKKTNIIIKSIILLSFCSVLLIGCSYATHFVQTGSRVYEETNPESIKIYSGEPKEVYTVIGSIAIDHAGASNENAIQYLREKAALLGADAVIHVNLSSMLTYRESIGISGIAVKFKK